MTVDLRALSDAYQAERPLYEKLAARVGRDLDLLLRGSGIRAKIEPRAKDVPSLMKKALTKQYADPLREITDKAGVRAIVNYTGDAERAEQLIAAQFDVAERTNKGDELEFDRLGYRGIHFLVRLKEESIDDSELELRGRLCEIQLHTQAQHAWSEVSHDLLYKPSLTPRTAAKKRLYRLVALVDIVDSEITEARREIEQDPAYREAAMLSILERLFLPLAADAYNADLSIRILSVVRLAYADSELRTFESLVSAFVRRHRASLLALYERFRASRDERALLILQPEALAVLERLEEKPELLRDVWQRSLPVELLDGLEDAWAITSK